MGFSCSCLATGTTWELGRTDHDVGDPRIGDPRIGDPRNGDPRIGKYTLSNDGIRRALACIEASLAVDEAVTVIDEIGPLELKLEKGFAPVLPRLRDFGDLFLVVRPELVSALVAYVPDHFTRVFPLSIENRQSLAGDIESFLG